MPFNLSTGELVVLLIVAVIVFGGRLPEVARSVGKTFAEVRRGVSDEMRRMDVSETIDDQPPPEWEPPPDGADCDGFGGPKPPEEETEPRAETEETTEDEEKTA